MTKMHESINQSINNAGVYGLFAAWASFQTTCILNFILASGHYFVVVFV